MSTAVATAYAATIAAGVVAVLALWRTGAWRRAQALVVLVVTGASTDIAALVWPDRFWTPETAILREGIMAGLGVMYAFEVACGLPRVPRNLALRGLLLVVAVTVVYVAMGWTDTPRAAYRVVALENVGAAGSLAVVLLAGLLYDVEFSSVTRRALGLLCACYMLQVAAIAPFEWAVPVAGYAQLVAAGAYASALLGAGRAAWATVPAR